MAIDNEGRGPYGHSSLNLSFGRVGISQSAACLKVGCAKGTNRLLFDPNQLERVARQKEGITKTERKGPNDWGKRF